MTQFDIFRRSSLETAGIGLSAEPETSGNLFTPLGATLIGWAGRDNAHFCFLEGYGETVFAVDPGCSGEFVYPVASTFSEFLGLVLACRGTEAIVMAWRWSRSRFEQFLQERSLTYKQRSILRAIQNTYRPPEISDPFPYLMEIRRGFDGSGLQFSPGLSDLGVEYQKKSELSVTFSNRLWAVKPKGKPGKKQVLNKTFSWGGQTWHIPAVYTCPEGLVVDFCIEASPEKGPENVDAVISLTLNGKRLHEKHGRGDVWDPWADNSWEALSLLEYYSCDREKGWTFQRKAFLWYSKRRPAMQSLKLTLAAKPVPIPGAPFQAPPVGESVKLTHPISGSGYTLTVKAYTQETLGANFLYDYPKHFTRMVYTLSPDLPDPVFTLRDCAESDPSEPPVLAESAELPDGAASIGIIGGADGPTAVFFTDQPALGKDGHIAHSSFHFIQPETVTWRMEFLDKPYQDLSLELLR